MTIPLGYFIQWINTKRIIKWGFFLIAWFFLFLNLFQTWQFNSWIFDGYSMTKEYYWRIFLKTSVTDEDRKYREIIRDFNATETLTNPEDYDKRTIGYLDFDKINTIYVKPEFIDTSVYLSPPASCRITKDFIYGPTFKIPYNQLTKKEHAWLKATIHYYPVHDLKESPVSFVIVMDHNNGQYSEHYMGWDLENYTYRINEWNTLTVDYLTPYPLSEKNDKFIIYVYLRGDKEIYIDDIHIDAFERKW